MGFQWQLAIHLFLTAVVVVSFLCGHWPIFEGTPIEKIHYFINVAARNYLLKAAEAICGTKGRLLFLTIEHYCCERPNPILQILYLMTIGITYFLAWKSALPFIPGYYVSEKHWYVSVIGVFMGILLFIITSVSDPGTINSNNATNYLAAYPFDCIIYTTKQCSTCNIPRPARSKHCSICNRCVARFDHHCGWMNNCIGERNLRYFLAFLFWHTILCFYGSAVLVAILLGEWKEQRVARILTVYYGVENSFTKLAPHFIQWAMGFYSTQFLLLTFLALLSLLLAGFFSYHVYLVITNMTTNETFKWDNYKMWHLSVAHAKEVTECHDCTTDTTIVQDGRRDLNAVKSKHNFLNCNIHWKKFYSKWLRSTNCSLPDNAYDKGLMLNIYEVFFPLSTRKSFNSTKID